MSGSIDHSEKNRSDKNHLVNEIETFASLPAMCGCLTHFVTVEWKIKKSCSQSKTDEIWPSLDDRIAEDCKLLSFLDELVL